MKHLISVLLLLLPLSLQAAIDTFEFKDEETRERFNKLTFELRCPKCQNQNLQDSNSPISSDLKNEIYRMLEAGNDDAEIVDFMVARYGDFVLYRPPVKPETWGLWFGPGVILLLVLAGLLRMYLKRRRGAAQVETGLNQDEQARLARLLGDDKGDV